MAKAGAKKLKSDREVALESGSPQLEIPFSTAEYRSRLDKIRQRMTKQKIDTLFVASPESMYYVSGFQAVWYQVQALEQWLPLSGMAIHVDSDKIIHFDNDGEMNLCKYSTRAEDLRILDRHEGNLLPFIVKNLKQEGWLKGTVGLETRKYRPNRAVSEAFEAKLVQAGCKRVIDGSDIVDDVRRFKSPQEMAYFRTAAKLTDIGMKAAQKAIRPGVTELDIYAETHYAMTRAGSEPSALIWPVCSGSKSLAHHSMPSRRQVMAGDVINIDCCGVYNRYHSNISRTYSVGEPAKDVAEVSAKAAGAFDVLLKHAKPGAKIQRVADALKAYYKDRGLWGNQWWTGGYELGAAFAPDWVGALSYDVERDNGEATFEEGMVVNYESNFYFPGAAGMTVCIDTMMFDQGKVEIPHRTPMELIVID